MAALDTIFGVGHWLDLGYGQNLENFHLREDHRGCAFSLVAISRFSTVHHSPRLNDVDSENMQMYCVSTSDRFRSQK